MKQTKSAATKPAVKRERIHAVSLKPLQHIPGDVPEDDELFACFVDTRGIESRIPCSLVAARRIEGGKPKGPKSYNGLDAKLDRDFIVHLEDVQGVRTVVGIDQFPKADQRRFMSKASDEEEDSEISLNINKITGDIDVLDLPHSVPVAALLRIIQKLHDTEVLEIGQEMPAGYMVQEITGNRVTLELQ